MAGPKISISCTHAIPILCHFVYISQVFLIQHATFKIVHYFSHTVSISGKAGGIRNQNESSDTSGHNLFTALPF